MNELHRNKAITKALESIKGGVLPPSELKHYFEMIYDIGHFNGTRQIANPKKVEQLKNGIVVNTYPSVTYAAKVTGVHKTSISKNIRDGSTSRKGSTFRFKQVS